MRRSEKMQFKINKRKYKADCPFDYEDGFKRGVEWADKNPKYEMVNKQKFIENACEWLKRNYTNYMINDLSKYVEDVCSFDIFDDLLVDDFRKAMGE